MVLAALILVFSNSLPGAAENRAIVESIRNVAPDVELDIRAAVPQDERAVVVEWSDDRTAVTIEWTQTPPSGTSSTDSAQPTSSFSSRTISFHRSDSSEEKGRTVGFVIAAFAGFLPIQEPRNGEAATRTPQDNTETRAPANGASTEAESRVRSTNESGSNLTSAQEAPSAANHEGSLASQSETRPWRGAIGLAFQTGAGFFDDAIRPDFGGEATGIYFLPMHLDLRLTAGVRAGSLVESQATSLWFGSSAGVGWTFFRGGSAFPLDWGIAVGAGGGRYSVSHFSSDDPEPVQQSAWLGYARLSSDVRYRVSNSFELVLEVGGEYRFTELAVVVGDETTAELNPWRFLGNIGVRIGL